MCTGSFYYSLEVSFSLARLWRLFAGVLITAVYAVVESVVAFVTSVGLNFVMAARFLQAFRSLRNAAMVLIVVETQRCIACLVEQRLMVQIRLTLYSVQMLTPQKTTDASDREAEPTNRPRFKAKPPCGERVKRMVALWEERCKRCREE